MNVVVAANNSSNNKEERGMGLQDETSCILCGERRRNYLFLVNGSPIVECPGCGLLSREAAAAGSGRLQPAEGLSPNPASAVFDSATEQEACRAYIQLLTTRLQPGATLLLIAPEGHPFGRIAAEAGLAIDRRMTLPQAETAAELGAGYGAAVVIYQFMQSHDPLALLERLREALTPAGCLLLTTKSLDTWPARWFRSRWPEWQPQNLHYFNANTLQGLLMKAGFGGIVLRPDRRRYTMAHIRRRAAALPPTLLTRLIRLGGALLGPLVGRARIPLTTSGVILLADRVERRERPVLSVIVPAYNERQGFQTIMDGLLQKRIAGMDKEIVVIESNSRDGTREAALGYKDRPEVKLILQPGPRGKGNAVREGLASATGDVVLIQDADLEYDMNDYEALLEPVLGYRSQFVLGARHGGSWKMRQFVDQQGLSTMLNFGHVFFTTLMNVLYRQHMKDPFTMYKVFRRECLYRLKLECNRFDFDHELVIKLCRKGYRPLEIPVNYRSRSFREGKKVRIFRDATSWIWVNFKYLFVSIYEPPDTPPTGGAKP